MKPGSRLTFKEIPDILVPEAYHGKLDDVQYVVHVASPLPNPTKDVIQPSVLGTANILEAALNVPTIRRVVLTSSIIANMEYPPPQDRSVTAADRTPDPQPGPQRTANPLAAYRTSKVLALNATDRFVDERQPHFSVHTIFPGYVFGRDERASNLETLCRGSNNLLLKQLTGNVNAIPQMSSATHVADVAQTHVLALDENTVEAGKDLGVTQPVVYNDAWDIVAKHFPEAVQEGIFSKGSQQDLVTKWDASETQKVLGRDFRTYEEAVKDTAQQYLDLLGKL